MFDCGFGYTLGGPWTFLYMGLKFLLIVGVVWFIASMIKKNDKRSNSGMEILNQRYANGEIDEEEYKRKREILINKN
ncbi:SHOCT domain-containing protein [Tepidibacter formicigenes]|jgi:putative membrane protein|uniref:Putative membrane protein n=1 Tax=Tepidibacter formicigenes DSM 15518 TaxID=1123349 RepID=A0A1M6LJS1_9FIRM|nr:SHOCT domain-containing protein [Tepidibacter formicigenes]SHJ71454.1 putative membrane protein [Tepidibacter formicigenes DSM 15518]